MPTTAITARVGKFYDGLDSRAGAKGYIERTDFEQVAVRIVESFQLTPQSSQAQKVHNSLGHLWDTMMLPADADGDGRVTRAEYIQAIVALADMPDLYEDTIGRCALTYVEAADVNGDGLVDAREFTTLHQANVDGLSDGAVAEVFHRLDRDGDGYLTADEMRQGFTEFFTSPDNDAPGTWLMGAPA
ncbi:EF-hand domain-containing protein [Streptomyces sp. ASQP_92]|uniref:EF-hand domain-containing protein n=1 Tax=Streptomyces sp. ASQP_92 TaxID=2979116 RepID=UPI0021C0B6ED|nr:EF-hand domain-containing protein [Streptomyces sp. ASQP_92]MCT9094157.1 EF-hand domain-containing protein [Streptomyces sp. ASQP_92]